MPRVIIPGVGRVRFPDNMDPAALSAAIEQIAGTTYEGQLKDLGLTEQQVSNATAAAAAAGDEKLRLKEEMGLARLHGALQEQNAKDTGLAIAELRPWAVTEENPLGAYGTMAKEAGGILNGAGNVTRAVARDIIEGQVTGSNPFPATSHALTGGKPEDYNAGLVPGGPIAEGVADAAQMLPTVAAGTAMTAAGVPPSIAFGLPMSASSFAATGDPVEAAKAGVIGAGLPGVGEASRAVAANGLAQAVNAGLLRPGANAAQKVVETVAAQGGIQAFMEGLNIPEYLKMSPEERKHAIIRNLAANSVFLAMDLPGLVSGGSSETQAHIKPSAKVGEAMELLVNDPTTMEALRVAADAEALRLANAAFKSQPVSSGSVEREPLQAEPAAVETPPVAVIPPAAPAEPVAAPVATGEEKVIPFPAPEAAPAEPATPVGEPAAPVEASADLSTGQLGAVGMGGAKPGEFQTGATPTSIKNATVDQERVTRGLPPAMEPARRSFGAVWDEAMALVDRDPVAQDLLIGSLKEKPRALTDVEDALLLHRQVDLQNEYARHARELAAAYDDAQRFPDRLEAVERHKALLNEVSNKLQELYDVNKAAGTETGRGLAARRMLASEDFTLAKMEMELRAARDGRPLSDHEREQLQKAHDRIAELQTQLESHVAAADQAKAQRAAEEAVADLGREASKDPEYSPQVLALAERIVARMETAAESARSRLKQKFATTATGVDPTILADVAIIGAAKLARGAVDFVKWSERMLEEFGEGIRPYLQEGFAAAQVRHDREVARAAGSNADEVRRAIRKDDLTGQRQAIVAGLGEAMKGQATKEELGHYVRKLALNFVRAGVKGRDEVVKAVHEELRKVIPEITPRETMDAISGYGEFKPLDPDAAKAALRDIRGQLQQLSKLEDIRGRKPPLKSGVERRTPSDEERRLIAQVNEAKRRFGVVSGDPARQLKSALDTMKTRLRNQINDLTYQISTRSRIVRSKTQVSPDVEAAALKAQRDALRAQFDEIFPKQGLTDAQRLVMAEKALEQSIKEYEARIAAKDTSPRRVSRQQQSAKLDALRTRRDALRAELEALRKANTPEPSNEALLADLKARMMSRLAEYQEKIARGDFAPAKRRDVRLDNEALRLKAKVEMEKARWRRGVELEQLRNRPLIQRSWGAVKESLNLPRAVLSSWDVSAVLRQGGFVTMGHPIRALKNIGPMLQALASRTRAAMVDQEIRNRPNAPLYARSKLFLATLDDTRLSQMEETFMSRLAGKIPGVGASERAYVTFLNKLRADSFDAMVGNLQRRGPTLNDAELKAVANYINVATGRGNMGTSAAAAETLAIVFFSPRLVTSRFQLLLGQPLFRGESGRIRRAIAVEYARFLAGMAAVYGLARLAGATVEDDPRSSDFGKLKFGNTRVDVLGGLGQVTVLLSRLYTGQEANLEGKVTPIRGDTPFGSGTSWNTFTKFMRSKLAPVPGAMVDTLNGKNVVEEKVTPFDTGKRLLVPLSFQDIYDVMQQDGVDKGVALGIISLFGAGLQQYDDPEKHKLIQRYMKLAPRGMSPEQRREMREQLERR